MDFPRLHAQRRYEGQKRLRERLKSKGVFYIIKKGDPVPKHYAEPYQHTTINEVGKLGLACVLQMPASIGSGYRDKIYLDKYRYSLFGPEAKEGVIAD